MYFFDKQLFVYEDPGVSFSSGKQKKPARAYYL